METLLKQASTMAAASKRAKVSQAALEERAGVQSVPEVAAGSKEARVRISDEDIKRITQTFSLKGENYSIDIIHTAYGDFMIPANQLVLALCDSAGQKAAITHFNKLVQRDSRLEHCDRQLRDFMKVIERTAMR